MHSQWRGERAERRCSVLRHVKRAHSRETVPSVLVERNRAQVETVGKDDNHNKM
jgi:hypothetical protein